MIMCLPFRPLNLMEFHDKQITSVASSAVISSRSDPFVIFVASGRVARSVNGWKHSDGVKTEIDQIE